MKGSTAETARKRPERPWTAARTMEVLRRCPLAIAQRLVHCAIALSTAVLGRVTKTMSVAPLLKNTRFVPERGFVLALRPAATEKQALLTLEYFESIPTQTWASLLLFSIGARALHDVNAFVFSRQSLLARNGLGHFFYVYIFLVSPPGLDRAE